MVQHHIQEATKNQHRSHQIQPQQQRDHDPDRTVTDGLIAGDTDIQGEQLRNHEQADRGDSCTR